MIARAHRLLHGAGAFLIRKALAERDRWPLLLPAAVGLGAGLYFLPASEPPWWPAWAVLAVLTALAWTVRHRPVLPLAVGALCVALGFAVATARTLTVAAPMIGERLGPRDVQGRVLGAEARPDGLRVLLDRLVIERLEPGATPVRIRIVVRGWRGDPPEPGSRIAALAVLMPPPGPAAPGTFDFARQAFFERLGGVGFALGQPVVTEAPDAAPGWAVRVAATRQALTQAILERIPGPGGALAAALVTGERGAIPEDVNDAMRDAGLYHLVSISGLHLALVAGLIFVGMRALLALWEWAALHLPIKKLAALAALAGTAGYLVLSGMAVPTQRAFLMTAIGLAAILLDRSPFSMRLVAWAALAILLTAPESVLGASFQLSFAAVAALIAAYEWVRERGWGSGPRGPWRRARDYVAGLAFSSLVAGLATAPFAVYHFNRVALYGIAANLVAVPLTGLWIMPAALIALVLMPFGLDGWAWQVMGWGVGAVIETSRLVAALPHAQAPVPAMPFASLLLFAGGGLWLCVWRRPWRLGGLGAIAAGLAAALLYRGPDLLVEGEGRLLAVRDESGELALSSRRAARSAAETWLRREGQEEAARWPADGEVLPWIACDGIGCLYRRAGHVVALVRHGEALEEDCAAADVVVALVAVPSWCDGPAVVIDRADLARRGTHALWLASGAVRVESVAEARGERPWVPVRPRREAPSSRGTGPQDDPAP